MTPQKSRRPSINKDSSSALKKSVTKLSKQWTSILILIVPPDYERVYSEYNVMERAYREHYAQTNPNVVINGAKEITPKLLRE